MVAQPNATKDTDMAFFMELNVIVGMITAILITQRQVIHNLVLYRLRAK